MKRLGRFRTSALAAWALITVLLALVMASPYLPHTTLYAQSVGPGGVPGRDSGGAVSSVFGRTGAVVAASGDYTAAQVTNAAATNVANTFTASQTAPSWAYTGNHNWYIHGSAGVGATLFYDETFGADMFGLYSYTSTGYNTGVWLNTTSGYCWSTGSGGISTVLDTCLTRASAGTINVGDGIGISNTSGTLNAATLTASTGVSTPNLTLGGAPIEQAATAPTGSCSALEWVLSNDGHLSYCSGAGGTWAEKF